MSDEERIGKLTIQLNDARSDRDELHRRIGANTKVLSGLVSSLSVLFDLNTFGVKDRISDIEIDDAITHKENSAPVNSFEKLLSDIAALQSTYRKIECLEENLKALGISLI